MAFIHLLSYLLLNAKEIHSHAIFFPLYHYTVLILNSIYKVEYTSIFNSCSFSIEVISWMLNSCCRGSICCCCCFKVLTKAKFSLSKLVFNGLIKILFRLVFFEINWNRGCSENVMARQIARTVTSVHAMRFLRAQNYVQVNQSKHLQVVLNVFRLASCFCVWKQIFGVIRFDNDNLFQPRSCC